MATAHAGPRLKCAENAVVGVITHAANCPLAWVVAVIQKKQGERHPDHARCNIRTLTWQAGRAVAHTSPASSHAFPCRQNFDNTGAVVCDSASMGSVKDHKANATLTKLTLENNQVGDAGAAAFADVLQATVFTCKKCVFRACVRCHRKCRFTKSSAAWASSTFLAGCVPVFV